jgi:hypothetical protein
MVLADPMAERLAQGVAGVRLAAKDIERFTAPLRLHLPSGSTLLGRGTALAA